MKQKLTPWYPGPIKPIRKGVYQRDFSRFRANRGVAFSYWNGQHWCFSDWTARAARRVESKSIHQHLPWRGVRK